MKKYNIFILMIVFVFALSSCYKETTWIDDNTTSEGKHFPVIPSFAVNTAPDGDGFYHSGDVLETEVNYWSIDPIKELSLYATLGDSIFVDSFYIDSIFIDTFYVDSIFIDMVFEDTIHIDSFYIDSIFIDSIRLRNVDFHTSLIETKPYLHDFNEETQMDHMFFNYTVPPIQPQEAILIELKMVVTNENGLDLSKTASIARAD